MKALRNPVESIAESTTAAQSPRPSPAAVSYEYVACQRDNAGVLILSEFAGAAQSLGAPPPAGKQAEGVPRVAWRRGAGKGRRRARGHAGRGGRAAHRACLVPHCSAAGAGARGAGRAHCSSCLPCAALLGRRRWGHFGQSLEHQRPQPGHRVRADDERRGAAGAAPAELHARHHPHGAGGGHKTVKTASACVCVCVCLFRVDFSRAGAGACGGGAGRTACTSPSTRRRCMGCRVGGTGRGRGGWRPGAGAGEPPNAPHASPDGARRCAAPPAALPLSRQTWADTFISELNDTHVEAELRTRNIPPAVRAQQGGGRGAPQRAGCPPRAACSCARGAPPGAATPQQGAHQSAGCCCNLRCSACPLSPACLSLLGLSLVPPRVVGLQWAAATAVGGAWCSALRLLVSLAPAHHPCHLLPLHPARAARPGGRSGLLPPQPAAPPGAGLQRDADHSGGGAAAAQEAL